MRMLRFSVPMLLPLVLEGVRDERSYGKRRSFASCPEAETKGYQPLLKRNGASYMIGNGEGGCTGTNYTNVMAVCDQEYVKGVIQRMDQFYSQSHFGVSPWTIENVNRHIVVYKASPEMEKHMNDIFVNNVNGIAQNKTFWEVFQTFADNRCPAVVWGGEVRDAASNISSMDTDVGWFCPQENVVEVLRNTRWGGTFKRNGHCPEGLPDNLQCLTRQAPTSYVQVGRPDNADEGFEGKSAYENVLGAHGFREFTTNALAYDPIHKIVLDPTGTGLCDTLKRQVSYPTAQGSMQAVTLENLQDFQDWNVEGFGKLVRLLKLVMPPKSFCVSQKTFALVGIEIFKSFFPTSQNFAAGLRALQHMIESYHTRANWMMLYAAELLIRFCSDIQSIASLVQQLQQQDLGLDALMKDAIVTCRSSTEIRRDTYVNLGESIVAEFQKPEIQKREHEQWWEALQRNLICQAS